MRGPSAIPPGALSKLRRMARSRIKYWPASTGEYVDAMLAIAQAFMEGWLVPRDYDEGRRWLQRAAEWGSKTEKAMLAECSWAVISTATPPARRTGTGRAWAWRFGRGVADRSPSIAPHRRTRSMFVGAELGLTGTLNGSTEDFTAWDNAAPLAGLEVGGYVVPSFAIVLGAAGASDLTAGHYSDADSLRFHNNQARFTLGAEAHHRTLFASAGGGVSQFTETGARGLDSYQYDHTS